MGVLSRLEPTSQYDRFIEASRFCEVYRVLGLSCQRLSSCVLSWHLILRHQARIGTIMQVL